jgi:hypothetical protein
LRTIRFGNRIQKWNAAETGRFNRSTTALAVNGNRQSLTSTRCAPPPVVLATKDASNSRYKPGPRAWIDEVPWQRLDPFQKLAQMLLDHLDEILNYCRVKPPLGVVEAINGNVKMLLRHGRGYKNLRCLLLKAQRIASQPDRICDVQESCVKWRLHQIPAQSRFNFPRPASGK